MFLHYLRQLSRVYTITVWCYDCACGLAPRTIAAFAVIGAVLVGYVHAMMHELVRVSIAFHWPALILRVHRNAGSNEAPCSVQTLAEWGSARWLRLSGQN
jgi:hypothetical protein